MSADYRPLRIARISDGRDTWDAFRLGDGWESFDPGIGFVTDSQVTDVRPLVVLDLDDYAWAAMVLRDPKIEGMGTRTMIADQIEAHTKPSRIPEPGFDGAVEASHVRDHAPHRRRFVRSYTNPNIGSHPWTDGDVLAQWSDLIDPTLIREGVES